MKKRVILMVGPQGAGKSTLAKKFEAEGAVRISQDDMGKDHLVKYEKALKEGADRIIVDRINHTRTERRRYSEMAAQYGYRTEILSMQRPFDECFSRIMARTEHPTIGNQKEAINALKMYFSQYEYPTANEAHVDSVLHWTTYDPFILSLQNTAKRTIIIGDVHGCYDELQELLLSAKYQTGEDRIIFCGDLVDRGPKVREVLEFAMNTPNVYCVMGNHENKLARHLTNLWEGKESKIQLSHGIQESLNQIKDMPYEKIVPWLWSLPMAIKVGDLRIFHAGLSPKFPLEQQSREFLLYARKYNPATGSFDNESSNNWYHERVHYSLDKTKIFFGHDVHDVLMIKKSGTADIYPMDGGCVFGGTLRGVIVEEGQETMIHVNSKQEQKHEPAYKNWFDPYEERVQSGMLSKQEKNGLVLYNYTDKCAFEKKWDKYTMESRGLIFEKATGKVIARPFPKFFNVGEMPETQLSVLPKEQYECFEKMDGSLGVVYFYDDKWNVATRGSFTSPQAKRATEMLENYRMGFLPMNVTILTEIIYPENRNSMGARLVIDYGTDEFLCCLGAYDRDTGREFTRVELESLCEDIGMHLVQKYDLTIDQMIAAQKTLPAEKEGFVVRFANGFRVKIKGEEYLKLHKILNSITPLNIYNLMVDTKSFIVPSEYLMKVPEEYRGEVLEISYSIRKNERIVFAEIYSEVGAVLRAAGLPDYDDSYKEDPEWRKKVGLASQKWTFKHKGAFFPYLTNNYESLNKYMRKLVRPDSNQLKDFS